MPVEGLTTISKKLVEEGDAQQVLKVISGDRFDIQYVEASYQADAVIAVCGWNTSGYRFVPDNVTDAFRRSPQSKTVWYSIIIPLPSKCSPILAATITFLSDGATPRGALIIWKLSRSSSINLDPNEVIKISRVLSKGAYLEVRRLEEGDKMLETTTGTPASFTTWLDELSK